MATLLIDSKKYELNRDQVEMCEMIKNAIEICEDNQVPIFYDDPNIFKYLDLMFKDRTFRRVNTENIDTITLTLVVQYLQLTRKFDKEGKEIMGLLEQQLYSFPEDMDGKEILQLTERLKKKGILDDVMFYDPNLDDYFERNKEKVLNFWTGYVNFVDYLNSKNHKFEGLRFCEYHYFLKKA